VQRATIGPRADSIYNARFVRGYSRLPTFDETAKFRDELASRVSDYLTRHPDLATSPRASQFRFERRVDLGMTKEEVTLLLGAPDAATADPDRMKASAAMFWPDVSKHAKEMWTYPSGWSLYFGADRLVDITVWGKPPIE
jgi:hypothetical protein